MTDKAISPLRQRMIEDMTIRKLAPARLAQIEKLMQTRTKSKIHSQLKSAFLTPQLREIKRSKNADRS
jgi:hypothetical protein